MITTCFTTLLIIAITAPSAWPATQRIARTVEFDGFRQESPPQVAGTWALTVETAQGTATPTVTLQQDGENLSGTYSSQLLGEHKVTGSIKGAAITFSFTASLEGNTVSVTYSGTVDKDTMKGKVTFGDLGEGTFTGRKT